VLQSVYQGVDKGVLMEGTATTGATAKRVLSALRNCINGKGRVAEFLGPQGTLRAALACTNNAKTCRRSALSKVARITYEITQCEVGRSCPTCARVIRSMAKRARENKGEYICNGFQ